MRRLVYSPKAFVYVMNNTPPPDGPVRKGGVYLHNISDLVVSGNVTRKVNQVSTAEITFRNPNRMYTQPGNPIFRPMDAITIFLQRLPGCPVQVFTGYLDTTPYFQMYPGTATMTASCTLKRLLHTYFDPGLPFVWQFMAQYGWTPDENGMMKSDKGGSQPIDQIQDSNLSELLFAVMEHIGRWKKETIHVEKLPDRLLNRLVNLYNTIEDNNVEASEEFAQFLKDFVGTAEYSGEPGDGGSASGGPKEFRDACNEAADKYGVDAAVLMAIGKVESDFGRNPATQRGGGGSNKGAQGPMQFLPSTWEIYGVDADGDGKKDIFSVKDAVYGAANYLNKSGFKQDKKKAIFAYNHADWYVDKVLELSKDYRSDTSDTEEDSDQQKNQDDKRSGQPDQEKPGHSKKKSSKDVKIYRPINGDVVYGRGWHEKSKGVHGTTTTSGHEHWHSGVDAAVPAGTPCIAPTDGVITMAQSSWSDGGMVHFKFTEDTGDISAGTIIGWGHVQKIYVQNGDKVKGGDHLADSGHPGGGDHVHFVLVTGGEGGGGDGNADPVPLLKALQKGETAAVDSNDSNNPNSSGDQALQAAKAAGLLTTFQFPSAFDQAESLLLQGDKSLMNDQALLPFVQELAQGALRSFMSLPNGDFYAFHPDYFDSYNTKPYWEIDDIEVLDASIQLSDDPLATHVYVVGATLPDQAIELSRKLTTAGVVNLFNAGTADFLNLEQKETHADVKKPTPFLGTFEGAREFVDHYGARPYVSESTFIRSHIFETFYAFQQFMLMWSRQFLTRFTFTFMPELYPGGLVSFPVHGIQCYIEEVNHQWDYTTGFMTTANLSAPSAVDKKHPISNGMVRAGVMGSDESVREPEAQLPKTVSKHRQEPNSRGD